MQNLINNIANLFKIKSLVTIMLTFGMIMLLSGYWKPSQEIVALYSASYSAVMTYFFTRKEKKDE